MPDSKGVKSDYLDDLIAKLAAEDDERAAAAAAAGRRSIFSGVQNFSGNVIVIGNVSPEALENILEKLLAK